MKERLVIVGGGQAAAQAVHTARKLGFEGSIALVGEEPEHPYQRPPLSKKYLSGDFDKHRLHLKSDKFYADRGVELMLGVRAEELDPAAQRVRLGDGRTLEYDRLLLATGSRARRLHVDGGNLPGVHYLRTIADADGIRGRLQRHRKLVVVGAGYIGLEVAASCRGLGLDVTVVEAAERVMSRVVCKETSAYFAARHAAEGVAIVCDAPLSHFEGRDSVTAVVTRSGRRFPCDFAVIGIGIEPITDLAERAGLACEDGIVVDACGCTLDPRIAAAGDCARQSHPWAGAPIRLESVHNAIEQSQAATKSLLGDATAFEEVPWFWSDQFDLKLQIVGLASGYDDVVVRGDPSQHSFAVYYLRQGQLIAIDAINSPKDFLLGKKLLPGKPVIPAQALADPNADLREFEIESPSAR